MSSQYGEHELILKHFEGRIGRFLDIGAFDGTTFSNTRQLYEMGWAGVCVEPNPPAFCALMRTYRNDPRVQLVNAAVGITSGPTPFWANTADALSADMMSTAVTAHKDKWQNHPFQRICVSTVTWDQITDEFGTNFDFVNIDVEGQNLMVLKDMPVIPEMLCYEHDPSVDGAEPLHILRALGYTWQIAGGNIIAIRSR